MFYAGPREALHHTLIREWLGFSHFSVGRHHAGSDNFYRPEEAKNTLKRYQDLFNIKILYHNGAYFCKSCNKIILKGSCKHKYHELKEVSGSKLRAKVGKANSGSILLVSGINNLISAAL